MMDALGQIEKYLHPPSNLPPLVHIALVHYQFEVIHPFLDGNGDESGLITIWLVVIYGKGGQVQQKVVRLGISEGGERSPYLERLSQELLRTRPSPTHRFQDRRKVSYLVNGTASELLHRELVYSGFLPEEASYSSRLLACMGLSGY
jgi:hypothetical protein